MNIYFEESLPVGAVDYSFLLLHSQNQCCDMWTRGGILDSLASHGHRAVAIDLPGAGRSILPNGTTHTSQQMSNFLHSVLEQLDLGKVILVADGHNASYVINYLRSAQGADVTSPMTDIVGCVLSSPDYRYLKSGGYLDINCVNCEIPTLLISDQSNPNILPSFGALQDLAESAMENPNDITKYKLPISLREPRLFVETILTFLSRLDPITV